MDHISRMFDNTDDDESAEPEVRISKLTKAYVAACADHDTKKAHKLYDAIRILRHSIVSNHEVLKVLAGC